VTSICPLPFIFNKDNFMFQVITKRVLGQCENKDLTRLVVEIFIYENIKDKVIVPHGATTF
jgi:hypothetical protein